MHKVFSFSQRSVDRDFKEYINDPHNNNNKDPHLTLVKKRCTKLSANNSRHT